MGLREEYPYTMSSLFVKKLKDSIGKNVIIYLKSGFRFEGRLLSCDDETFVFLDDRKLSEKIIRIENVSELEVL